MASHPIRKAWFWTPEPEVLTQPMAAEAPATKKGRKKAVAPAAPAPSPSPAPVEALPDA